METNNTFYYNFFGRILFVLLSIVITIPGLIFILFGGWFILLGIVFVAFGFFRGIDMIFFKSLEFSPSCLIKTWYIFGSLKMDYDDMDVTPVKRMWSGQIFFDNKKISLFQRIFMSVEMFPIGNKDYARLLAVLKDRNIPVLWVSND